MRMQFTGAPEITASRDRVWQCLMDPQFVAQSAPGVESVETIDPNHFKVISAFGVGSIKLRFALDVELYDVNAPESAKMRAKGKAPGSAVQVNSTMKLEELGPNGTRLTWSADSEVSGTVASIGGRLMEGTARKLSEQFWNDFASRVSQTG